MKYKEFVELFNSGNVPKLTGHVKINHFFRLSCSNGHLVVAKWLWEIYSHKINLHAMNDSAFRWCCLSGHLDIAKWWEISDHKINIHAKNNYAFKYSCENSRFIFAKWLWIISGCTIAFSKLKEYHAELAFLNTHSKKYKYKFTDKYDNLHMLHHYYRPVDGPGYLWAISDF